MHKQPCHHAVTNGTKATSAGSSKNKIAKVRRCSKKNAAFNARMAQGLTRHEEARPGRWPAQKWPSRKFNSPKRGKQCGQ